MILYFTSRLIWSLAAFLYPGYASYKTLSQRPASEEDLERWLMYWSVLGFIIGVECIAEWLLSWIPFYYTLKTLFLLYLALPQTCGSSYIYINHLQPFFHSHESQIDAALASIKGRVYSFFQERLRALWEHLAAALGQQPQPYADMSGGGGAVNAASPPSLASPASGPLQLVSSLWTSYGPVVLATGAAFMRQSAAAANTRPGPSQTALNTPPPSHIRSLSVLQRRRQLQAELETLEQQAATAHVPDPLPIPAAGSQVQFPSRGSSDSDLYLRSRTISGRFEEIEMVNDVEEYDVGKVEKVVGVGYDNPTARGSSWFGWGGKDLSSKGKYERVKNE